MEAGLAADVPQIGIQSERAAHFTGATIRVATERQPLREQRICRQVGLHHLAHALAHDQFIHYQRVGALRPMIHTAQAAVHAHATARIAVQCKPCLGYVARCAFGPRMRAPQFLRGNGRRQFNTEALQHRQQLRQAQITAHVGFQWYCIRCAVRSARISGRGAYVECDHVAEGAQ